MHSSFLAQKQAHRGYFWSVVASCLQGWGEGALAFHIYTVSNVSDSCLPGTLKVKRVGYCYGRKRWNPLSASVLESKSVILRVFSVTFVLLYGPWSPTVLRASFDGVMVSHTLYLVFIGGHGEVFLLFLFQPSQN